MIQRLRSVLNYNNNDVWIIPLSTLVGPCSVYINKKYGHYGNTNLLVNKIDNMMANVV